jgi:hypothetical protein
MRRSFSYKKCSKLAHVNISEISFYGVPGNWYYRFYTFIDNSMRIEQYISTRALQSETVEEALKDFLEGIHCI